jgi:hypothetical protein
MREDAWSRVCTERRSGKLGVAHLSRPVCTRLHALEHKLLVVRDLNRIAVLLRHQVLLRNHHGACSRRAIQCGLSHAYSRDGNGRNRFLWVA